MLAVEGNHYTALKKKERKKDFPEYLRLCSERSTETGTNVEIYIKVKWGLLTAVVAAPAYYTIIIIVFTPSTLCITTPNLINAARLIWNER